MVFKKYAPATDNNDPNHYIKLVKSFTGLDSSRTIGDLNDGELIKFMGAIERVEGWKVGKVELIPHAQQFAVKGVDGKPLSGLDYIMNFFTKTGEEKKIKGKTDKDCKTTVAKTDTKSPVKLELPRPDPGQSFKGTASGKKTADGKKVLAAEVNAKPWYEMVFSTAEPSIDLKDGAAATEKKEPKEKPNAPAATVKQTGAIKASGTQKKENKFIEPVTKEPGVFVTWQFETHLGSGKVLNGLPYFIAEITGDKGIPLVTGQQVKLMRDNKIRQKVPFGKEVALYLGNDAKAQYRTKPMYKVSAEEGLTDIIINVIERAGLNYFAVKEQPHDEVINGAKKTYIAHLYGTTWMNFSHKFTEIEASESTKGTSAEVQEAVKQIYRGAPTIDGRNIRLTVPKPNGKTLKILWPPHAFENCRTHIPAITGPESEKIEIITRVNPNTYQAFIQAAFDMDAEEMDINSGWRPMLGSVLHRIGVGLDVGRVKMNGHDQVFFRSASASDIAYSNAIKERSQLEMKKKRTSDEDDKLKLLKATEGDKAHLAAVAIHDSDNDLLRQFTSKLRGNAEVRSTFDPWEMESNTSDNVKPAPNYLRQGKDGNEYLHRNHLHITVYDAELGHGN